MRLVTATRPPASSIASPDGMLLSAESNRAASTLKSRARKTASRKAPRKRTDIVLIDARKGMKTATT